VRQTAAKHDIILGGLEVDSVPAPGQHDATQPMPLSPPDKAPVPPTSEGYFTVSMINLT